MTAPSSGSLKPPRSHSSLNTWLICGGLVLGALLLAAFGLSLTLSYQNPPPRQFAQPEPKRSLSRDQLKNLIIGKSAEDLLQELGRPSNTREYSQGDQYWVYENISYDPISGNRDRVILVYFEDGKVSRINF